MANIRDLGDLNVDVSPVVEAISQIATTLEEFAKDVRRAAEDMYRTGDLEYGSEALQAIKNCQANVRIDLIQARTLRAIERAIRDADRAEGK